MSTSRTSPFLSVGKVARMCGVSNRTVLNWIGQGKIEAHALPSGHFRVHVDEVRSFMQANEMELPARISEAAALRDTLCWVRRDLTPGHNCASCAVLDGKGYVGTFGNQVLGIDLVEGRILWRYEHEKYQFPFYSSAAVDGNVVVVGGRDKMVHALDPETGEALWTFAAGARVDSSPVLVGDRVFFGSERGIVHALDVATGEETWRFETGSAVVASPAVADGKLVIGADNGVLYCFGEAG